ncbi:MAG: YebC/PmpR family DNA-binding transcriptional regulator, partial [Myxococcota bacterium]
PKDNIERAILKGIGDLEGVNYEDVMYEAYGPSGGALIIETTTDNPNRTVAEIRHILSKHDGNLGKNGTVAWKFDKKGIISIKKETIDEDALMEIALEVGAEDFKTDEEPEYYILETDPSQMHSIVDKLKKQDVKIDESEIQMIPKNTVKLTGKDAEKAWKIYSILEDHDDVDNVWHDFEIDDEELERLASS